MVDYIQQDDVPEVERVEPPVKRRKVNTVEIGHPVAFEEVSWNPVRRDYLSPLAICPDSGKAGLERLPDGCGRLATLSCLPLQGGIDLF